MTDGLPFRRDTGQGDDEGAMSDWSRIGKAYHALVRACGEGGPLDAPWAEFVAEAMRARDHPPMHLVILFECLAALERASGGRELVIVEHGCGAGQITVFLLALGYRGVHGVDIGGENLPRMNRVFRECRGIGEARLGLYDGRTLPLADGAADLVFSQQVLEHVTDDVLDDYYADEARVLRPGGLAYHQLPHRWAPYDSHSRTWLLHWLPRPLQLACYRLFGRNADYLDRILHLRAPGAHLRRTRRFIGPVVDKTIERLTRLPDMARYEGSARLRLAIYRLVRLPVVGRVAAFALKRLTMLDTVATRR